MMQLTATVSPEDAENKNLEWTSSNEDIATVDQSGLVTAVLKGNAAITVCSTDGSGISAVCNITVKRPVSAITLSETDITMKINECIVLTATVIPDDATENIVTWHSDTESVATVDADGNVTSIAAGKAVITATCGDASAECMVTVDDDISGLKSVCDSDARIRLIGSEIVIDGMTQGRVVSLYDIAGALIAQQTSTGGSIRFNINYNRVYILRIGNRWMKLAIQ